MILRKTVKTELPKLTRISKAAFDTDCLVGGTEPGGPPDYDSDIWHESMMDGGHLYTAIYEDQIIGGAIPFPNADQKEIYIGRIFADPVHFRKGYGITIMDQIKNCTPDSCASWILRYGMCAQTASTPN